MEANQKQWEINEYAESAIRGKARQLVGIAGFNSSDVEDIEQEFRIELLDRLPMFDSTRASYKSFVNCVLNGKAAKLIRYHSRQQRDFRRNACSLDELVKDADGCVTERAQTIDRDKADIRAGRRERTRRELAQLKSDIAMVLESLPADLREVAECVMSTATITEAAQKLEIPRMTLYGSLKRLKRIFEAAGLDNYLEVFSSFCGATGYLTVEG